MAKSVGASRASITAGGYGSAFAGTTHSFRTAGAQVLAQRCEIEAKRLLRDRLLRGLCLRLGGRLHRLVAVLEAAERDLAGFLGALADDDDVDLLANRGVGHDARQILRLPDVL